MDTDNELTLQDAIDLLPKHVSLVYVDYRDNLDESIDKLQECIHNQDYSSIDEATSEWFWESEADSVDYLLKELVKELQSDYDLTDEEAQAFVDENEEELKEVLYDRNDSNPLTDLLRNTQNPVCFYDTGYEVVSETWAFTTTEMRREREAIKRALHIPAKNHRYDGAIVSMLANASYGGRLVVYFRLDTSDFDTWVNLGDKNTIRFTDPMIAIIDTYNGSGDSTDLPGHVCDFPLLAENVIFDKTIKYNYTYAVCGMSSNWCDCTGYELLHTDKRRKAKTSSVNAELQQEQHYNEVYKSGKCSFGDMDMRRHRSTHYENGFPAGTRCNECGTFWID